MNNSPVWRIVAFMRGTAGAKWTVLQLAYALGMSMQDVSVCLKQHADKFTVTKLGKDHYYSLKSGGKNATNTVHPTHRKR